jgi:hypothetical protein
MDPNLLEKYWNAETSPKEEAQLLTDMADSTHPDAVYFAMLAAARKQKSDLTIADFNAYNARQDKAAHAPATQMIIPLYRWIASAAAILVFVLSGIGLWKYSQQATQPVQMAETFDDPYEAYQEVREALAFVSSRLNKSQSEAMINIQKAGKYAEMFK